MSKQRKNIIVAILILIALIGATFGYYVTKKDEPKDIPKDDTSSVTSKTVNVEEIEDEQHGQDSVSSKDTTVSYIEPDETEADKILEEKKKEKILNSSSASYNNSSVVSKTESGNTTVSSSPQSFEEGKTSLENKAMQYLIEHNIDPKTAGETGELCQHCGKKIWNPDKYGNFIPGMPENYENSGYCLGTCGISFE